MDEQANTLNRRDAMRHLVTGATAIAGGGLISGCATSSGGTLAAAPAQASAPRQNATAAWDMSWRERITRPHRMVFDSPEYGGGIVFRHATNWMSGYAAAYGAKDEDLNVVLVIRHAAVAMVLNHEMWERLSISITDTMSDEGGAPAANRPPAAPAATAMTQTTRRNPYIGAPAPAGGTARAGQLDGLVARGAIVLACNLALSQYYSRLRTVAGITQPEAQQQVRAALVPGTYVMPNGIFAVGCAQEAGCQFIKSS